MGVALGIIGLLGFVGCVVWIVVLAIRKLPKKACALTMLVSAALFFIGVAISPSEPSQNVSTGVSSNQSQPVASADTAAYDEALEKAQKELEAESAVRSDGRITQEAYEKIKTGMTYDEVKSIVGSEGRDIFESGDKGTDSYSISYMWIGEKGGEATIGFSGKDELTVLMKSQSGLN